MHCAVGLRGSERGPQQRVLSRGQIAIEGRACRLREVAGLLACLVIGPEVVIERRSSRGSGSQRHLLPQETAALQRAPTEQRILDESSSDPEE